MARLSNNSPLAVKGRHIKPPTLANCNYLPSNPHLLRQVQATHHHREESAPPESGKPSAKLGKQTHPPDKRPNPEEHKRT